MFLSTSMSLAAATTTTLRGGGSVLRSATSSSSLLASSSSSSSSSSSLLLAPLSSSKSWSSSFRLSQRLFSSQPPPPRMVDGQPNEPTPGESTVSLTHRLKTANPGVVDGYMRAHEPLAAREFGLRWHLQTPAGRAAAATRGTGGRSQQQQAADGDGDGKTAAAADGDERRYTDVAALEAMSSAHVGEHTVPRGVRAHIAYALVAMLRPFVHSFFGDRYLHHACVLECVAAVPGLVASVHRHFAALRWMRDEAEWVAALFEEAENERMHLLTWLQVCEPTRLERMLVVAAQLVYTPAYALMYIVSPTTAHRFVGYLEEEAVQAYTDMLAAIDDGRLANVAAPQIAIEYWNLHPKSTLRDVVVCVRNDEMMHRDCNHSIADGTADQLQMPKR